MRLRTLIVLLVGGLSIAAFTGCGAGREVTPPSSNPISFSNPTVITNPYLPISAIKLDIIEGSSAGKAVRVERTLKPGTKTFMYDGKPVQTVIMEDRDFVDEVLEEVTLDYFAQDDAGNVYYFGEDVDNYENGQVLNHDGAWLVGVDTNQVGLIMPANPKVGDEFRPEDVPSVNVENDEVVSVSETVTVPAGTFTNCLKIKEVNSDGETEYKYYAPNVGVVKQVPPDGEQHLTSRG